MEIAFSLFVVLAGVAAMVRRSIGFGGAEGGDVEAGLEGIGARVFGLALMIAGALALWQFTAGVVMFLVVAVVGSVCARRQ